jgi:hypothetical protein
MILICSICTVDFLCQQWVSICSKWASRLMRIEISKLHFGGKFVVYEVEVFCSLVYDHRKQKVNQRRKWHWCSLTRILLKSLIDIFMGLWFNFSKVKILIHNRKNADDNANLFLKFKFVYSFLKEMKQIFL